MSASAPARLTSALLARKGHAVPAPFSDFGRFAAQAAPGPSQTIAPPPPPTIAFAAAPGALAEAAIPVRPIGEPPIAAQAVAAQSPLRVVAEPSALPSRVRMTLRARTELHHKVKLSARHLGRSMNDVMTEALTRYLDQLGPEVLTQDWVRASLLNGETRS